MRLKVDQFCTLATSPSWQAWLYQFDSSMYKHFVAKLQSSKGCSHNKDLMINLLRQIEAVNGTDRLYSFISKNYAHMIIDDGQSEEVPVKSSNTQQIFDYYNPQLLTYPRRIIFEGDERSLRKKINEFVLDKIKYDSIIQNGKGYVEYLTQEDRSILNQVPAKNWQIAVYRLKNNL